MVSAAECARKQTLATSCTINQSILFKYKLLKYDLCVKKRSYIKYKKFLYCKSTILETLRAAFDFLITEKRPNVTSRRVLVKCGSHSNQFVIKIGNKVPYIKTRTWFRKIQACNSRSQNMKTKYCAKQVSCIFMRFSITIDGQPFAMCLRSIFSNCVDTLIEDHFAGTVCRT